MRWLSFLTTGWIICNVSCILLYLSAFCFPLNISDSYLPKSKKEKACCQSDWFLWAKLAQRRCFLSFCPIEHLADDISLICRRVDTYTVYSNIIRLISHCTLVGSSSSPCIMTFWFAPMTFKSFFVYWSFWRNDLKLCFK